MEALKGTNFNLNGQSNFYKGKVRDVYSIGKDYVVMVASDRISAFDVVLPEGIPFKGQVLNKIAYKMLQATADIVPNWLLGSPTPNVSVGKYCKTIPVEMVIRAYLTGHAWREYRSGKRELCGVALPEGMKEHDKFPSPIITPATKAEEGHDEDISREDIIAQGIVEEKTYEQLEAYTRHLFQRGTEIAAEQGLILVDTKYEFGMSNNGEVILIDEIHTPDSSRYFYSEGYQERQDNGKKQKQLSKEFVREWLMENNFQGIEGQTVPDMPEEFVNSVSNRYIELYEKITGETFVKEGQDNLETRINAYLTEELVNS